ncbi:MAG: 2-C-methyl-D-erythritol 4-phosphate cytidylyltransferase [Eubacteriaceae bacterium]|nr:2-C-methyl-D-erythritol 4-phosphate cytidylyltransferase [Eubacteriaceae bacterium]
MNNIVTAIIAAGGSGSRIPSQISKQYLPLDNKPVIVYSYEELAKSHKVDAVIIVAAENEISICESIIAKFKVNDKPVKIVPGGSSRQKSVLCGLNACDENTKIALIHDGARPFITNAMIDDCIKTMDKYKACSVGVSAINTIKQVDDNNVVIKTLDRCKIWEVQTPQCFDYKLIRDLHIKAEENNINVTDDCTLAEINNIEVKMINGSYDNIKITVARDLFTAQEIIKQFKRG